MPEDVWVNDCHKCQIERVMEHPLKINLVCLTEMFRINIKVASATLSLVSST